MKNIIKLQFVIMLIIIMFTVIACGPPRLKGTVSIDGDHILGNTLNANLSSLGGSGIISYQWMRNGNPVDGINGTTYSLDGFDKDAIITVTVTRSDNSGSVTSAPLKISYPLLNGKINININGNTMSVNTTNLENNGIISSYKWLRNENIIEGADNATYILQDADRNSGITVMVTSSGNSGSVTSDPIIIKYLIGDAGPGGGIVFYRNLNGFTMADTGEKAYHLEVAPVSQGQLFWASSSFTNRDIGTNYAIGTGRRNTTLILSIDSAAPAALACKNYNGGGKIDWFLPSFDELTLMYEARTRFGITTIADAGGRIWSSSQYDNYYATNRYFRTGQTDSIPKGWDVTVYAIRAF